MSVFNEAFEEVIGLEGGYVFDPADLGGETKYGISKAAYPQVDIKNLTLEQAKEIYFRDYWNKMLLGQLVNADVATELFEQGVNFGRVTAVLHAQKAVNLIRTVTPVVAPITEDGLIGPQTLKALNAVAPTRTVALLKTLNGLQFMRYVEIVKANPTQRKFFVGWLKRVGSLI